MAKLHSSALFCLCIFLFLLASTEIQVTQAKLCQRLSKTWSGFCGNTGNCNRQCRNWEGASSGACHARFPGFACFCYFKC